MRSDPLNGVTAFVAVARTRSFVRAADDLGVATASVSAAVKGLETRLGVRLFNRTTRSVALTEAGAAYFERVGPAAQDIAAAERMLVESRSQVNGRLRLSLPWIGGPFLIEPLLAPFLAAYPDLAVDLAYDDGFVDIVADGFDAGLRIGELLEKDMVGLKVGGPLAMAVLASPGYLARAGTPHTPADLAGHRLIAYALPGSGRAAPWEFADSGRIVSYQPRAAVTANSLHTCLHAAGQGMGITFVARALAADLLARGKLVEILKAHAPTYEPLHLYWPNRSLMEPKLRAFVDFVRANREALPV